MTMDVKRLVCSVNFGANVNATVKKQKVYGVGTFILALQSV